MIQNPDFDEHVSRKFSDTVVQAILLLSLLRRSQTFPQRGREAQNEDLCEEDRPRGVSTRRHPKKDQHVQCSVDELEGNGDLFANLTTHDPHDWDPEGSLGMGWIHWISWGKISSMGFTLGID